jgi:hypothetical protein
MAAGLRLDLKDPGKGGDRLPAVQMAADHILNPAGAVLRKKKSVGHKELL